MSEIAFSSTHELAKMICDKQIKSIELLDYYLDRIERYNSEINAIIFLDVERARADAKNADAELANGKIRGPLHGVPISIKESYSVAGLPNTFGKPSLKDMRATEDALSVQRLKAAGAVIFGKTNVPLDLSDFQSYNEVYGTTNNPWDLKRAPGGSSGGAAAALAAGLTGFESGSDIGGSIRNPAHYCGVFGHKPTWNLIPPRGHAIPGIVAASDLSVIGPLARSATDLALGIQVMAGPDEIMSRGYQLNLPVMKKKSLQGLKVATWLNSARAPVSKDVQNRVMQVSQMIIDGGGSVDFEARADIDENEHEDVYQVLLQAIMASRKSDKDYANPANMVALHSGDKSDHNLILQRQTASYRDYIKANERRTHFRWKWHEFFSRYDAMLAPIMATSAFLHDHRPFKDRTILVDGQERPYFEQVFWSGLAISSLLPSVVVPTGLDAENLPIGIQIIGPEYSDLILIEIAELLEKDGCKINIPPAYK